MSKPVSEETRRKLSKAHKGRQWTPEQLANRKYLTGEDHPNYKKPMSDEQKAKISKAQKERYARNPQPTGEANHNYGKTNSEETRAKISAGNRGKVVSAETRQKLSDFYKRKREAKALAEAQKTE